MKATSFIVALAVGSALPLAAQTRPSLDSTNPVVLPPLFTLSAQGAAPRPDPRDPAPPATPRLRMRVAPPASTASTSRSRTVCGTTLIDADPRIDPRIQLPPVATNGKFAIRAIVPSICVEQGQPSVRPAPQTPRPPARREP
jgi:hypothetical protein